MNGLDHIAELERRIDAGETFKPAPTPHGYGSMGGGRSKSIKEFHGDAAISTREGFHPAEVKLARRAMPTCAHMIQSDGSVKMRNYAEAQRFREELKAAKRKLGVPESKPW